MFLFASSRTISSHLTLLSLLGLGVSGCICGCMHGVGVCMVWVYAWCGCMHGVGVCMVWVYAWCGCMYGVGVCMVWVYAWCGCIRISVCFNFMCLDQLCSGIPLIECFSSHLTLLSLLGLGSILVHCISGWDRTPLFISLLRLTLWAVSGEGRGGGHRRVATVTLW